jgi:hypothetical protein
VHVQLAEGRVAGSTRSGASALSRASNCSGVQSWMAVRRPSPGKQAAAGEVGESRSHGGLLADISYRV